MGSLQLLTLYFTLTQIFSVGKAKINLHMTLKINSIHVEELSNAISPPSFFFNIIMSVYSEHHSLNA